MMVQLNEAVEYLERWDSGVAVVLVGKVCITVADYLAQLRLNIDFNSVSILFLVFRQGLKAFCAGADLSLAREHLTTASVSFLSVS